VAITFTGLAATSGIAGNNLGSQYLFCLENKIESRVAVYVRRLYYNVDCQATLTSVVPHVRALRATNIQTDFNATVIQKGYFDSTQTSDPSVHLWSGPPAGAGISGITGTIGNRVFSTFSSRFHTAVEQWIVPNFRLLPRMVENATVLYKLLPGESIVCQVLPSVVGAFTLSDIYYFNISWDEEPITMHTISGTVSLSGTGVVGAKVFVIIADDTAMTNAYLWTTVTTGALGYWECTTIPDGKIAYAYAQNYTGGIYYTATGAPYVS
jgi:hypothetical protein